MNFDASDYTNLIIWNDAQRCEPAVTKSIKTEALRSFIGGSVLVEPVVNIPKFPCHTQAIERHIKLVIEASVAVCGFDRRDGFIRAKLESRSKMKTYNTKSEFKV